MHACVCVCVCAHARTCVRHMCVCVCVRVCACGLSLPPSLPPSLSPSLPPSLSLHTHLETTNIPAEDLIRARHLAKARPVVFRQLGEGLAAVELCAQFAVRAPVCVCACVRVACA